MSEFSQRRGIVTGAASGIGKATALRLRREGASVLAVDINEAGLADATAAGCETLVADLGEPGDRDRLIAEADGVEFLVNAAGIILIKNILEATVEEWRRIQTVNAESTFFLCQQIGQKMPRGAIVNLSSSSAKLANTTEAAVYAASKTTILSITRSFAYTFAARGVRVNAICPGVIDTPMQDHVLDEVAAIRGMGVEELGAARASALPLGRPASPDECAGVIAFLLSDQSAYMTGQAINFTGGMVTW